MVYLLYLFTDRINNAAADRQTAVPPAHPGQGTPLPSRVAHPPSPGAPEAPLLVLLSDLHGDRGGAGEGAARQGNIRVDNTSLPVLQERTAGMEEQRAA